jgi:N-acetyl-alpha-D-muramate 1-phosphate uridylyltransferase
VTRPTTAMVLAAGLGTRMRPLTLERPKALIPVAGRALIDHVLDRLAGAGITRVVVNVHAHANQLEAHLAARKDLEVTISDERAALLETGGGLRAARRFLGEDPILVANIDSIWTEPDGPLIERLIVAWDEALMDDLLTLAPLANSVGFDGPGDFFRGADGRLAPRGEASGAPHAYMGLHMLNPAIIDGWPDSAHGIFGHWLGMAQAGRLHGVVMEGLWMHVGDPVALAAAEARLANGA